MSRTCVIIGARGFVGAHAARAFVRAGWTVHLFGPPGNDGLIDDLATDVVDHLGSIEDESALRAMLAAAVPEVVVSFAAFSNGAVGLARAGETDAARAFAVNVDGFRRLLTAAADAGVPRVVWASSTTVYGPASDYGDGPVDEDSPVRPRLVYGLTKVMGEQLGCFFRDTRGLEVCGLRIPLVIGPGCWYRGAAGQVVDLFAAAAAGQAAVLSGPTALVDFQYVTDAAAAFLAVAAHAGPVADCYNVAGFTARFADLATAVGRHTGRPQDYGFRPVEPPIVYPLIRAERIGYDLGFASEHNLEATAAAFLAALHKDSAP